MNQLKQYFPYIIPVFIFLGVAIALFPDAMQGKVVEQPDMIQSRGKENETKIFREKTSENSLWTNSLFSGMPTYYISARYNGNVLQHIHRNVLTLGLPKVLGLFFLCMFSAYIFFLSFKINPWISMLGGLAMGLCSYNFLIFEAGHSSKLMAIAYFPLVSAGVLLAYNKKLVLGGLLFAISFGLLIWTSHLQMVYYLGLALGLYVLIKFIESIITKEFPSFGKATLILLVGALLALGSNTSRLFSAYKYGKETIRGKTILKVDKAASNDNGLDKDYVFNWSQGITESLTFLVPGFMGGSSQEAISKESATYKDLKRKGARGDALKFAPLYWGDQPVTGGPVYYGAIMIFLFLLGAIIVRGSIKWWLVAVTILAMLLSFGKNLMWFSDIFYYYFPMYDKFRAVSSILVLLQLTVPTLGVLGLWQIVSNQVDQKKAMRAVLIAGGVTGGLCLILALLGGGIFDFTAANDARYQQAGYNTKAFIEDRQSLLRGDALRSFFFILAGVGVLFVYLKDSIKGNWKKYALLAGIPLLVIIDMAGIGKRYLNSDDFVNAKRYKKQFTTPRAVDKQILQDPDPHYRVHDLSINSFNSNIASRVHKTIGGYHAVKLRRYNDMIERHIGQGNQQVLNMLNMKYIITREQQAQQNPGALGNAWFVQNIQKVNTPNEEINALNGFDPKSTAIVHNEFSDYLGGLSSGDGQGSIELTNYAPNRLTYSTNTNSEQLAVFSEIWYNPAKGEGWQAFVDGKEVNHIRANYVTRAMKIPAGQHKVEFVFKPAYFQMGEMISLGCSVILILIGIGFISKLFIQSKN